MSHQPAGARGEQVPSCSCDCSHLHHEECDDVCMWHTLRLTFIETLGRWVADAVATEAVDEGLMPLVMTNPRAVDAGETLRGLLHDDRERIARNIEAKTVHEVAQTLGGNSVPTDAQQGRAGVIEWFGKTAARIAREGA